jgi:hypothetical protein
LPYKTESRKTVSNDLSLPGRFSQIYNTIRSDKGPNPQKPV